MENFTKTNQWKIASAEMDLEEYTHVSGAKLIYFNNGSQEKSFAAAFKTVPSDSTGVFHILEHSALSGSENYPVASPILYMMKNSMQTFLNAVTFQGKTVYPCASCNEKDFENLMKVYLDAVFKPNLSRDTFLREGWHLEKRGEKIAVSGVVFNEMNGAMSSPEQIVYRSALATMYPATYQSYNSGGEPASIPSLTYEKYLESYREYYSVNNCLLLLSGKQDLARTFSMIDGYLSNASHTAKQHEYTRCLPIVAEKEYTYPVRSEGELKGNSYIVFSYHLGDYGDEEIYDCGNILYSLLLSENSSVLKSALLRSGLCRDVNAFMTTEYQRSLSIVIYKTEGAKKAELERVINDTLTDLVKNGIDENALKAVLAEYTFSMKEKSAALKKRALDGFFTVADNVFFNTPLTKYLEDNDEIVQKNGEYFCRKIEEIFLQNNHRAVTVVSPELSDGAKKMEKLFADVTAKMKKETIEEHLKAFEDFSSRRDRGDSEEALAKMPSLTKEDLKAAEFAYREPKVLGGNFFTQAATNGIVYRRDYFSMQGFSEKELMAVKFLASALYSLPTSLHAAGAFATEKKFTFGRIRYDVAIAARSIENAEPYFRITSAFFVEKEKKALSLIEEMLLSSNFERGVVAEILSQEIANVKMSFAQNGMGIASGRALASLSEAGKIRFILDGPSYLSFLEQSEKETDALITLLRETAKKLFVRARAAVGITAEGEKSLLPLALPQGEKPQKITYPTQEKNVAYALSSTVNYNVKAVNYQKILPYTGKHLVMGKLLSLGYLWRTVREKGNAYGTNLAFSCDGTLTISSYRDPKVKETYAAFDSIGEFLKASDISEKEIFGCMLSIAGDISKPMTAEEESIRHEFNLLCGLSAEKILQIRREAMSFGREDIPPYLSVFNALPAQGVVCTAGNRSAEEASGLFREIIDL